MMTLSVSSGTWSDVKTAMAVELSMADDPPDVTGRVIDKSLRAALRELDIQVQVEVQSEIPI
ncbi:MAG: hypothetical protein KAJ42_14350 [Gemmatimonadetes bacterium]|nr:hypothetical protein [Gemmatimonadota bacterium]